MLTRTRQYSHGTGGVGAGCHGFMVGLGTGAGIVGQVMLGQGCQGIVGDGAGQGQVGDGAQGDGPLDPKFSKAKRFQNASSSASSLWDFVAPRTLAADCTSTAAAANRATTAARVYLISCFQIETCGPQFGRSLRLIQERTRTRLCGSIMLNC
jgi:hypothetical protein